MMRLLSGSNWAGGTPSFEYLINFKKLNNCSENSKKDLCLYENKRTFRTPLVVAVGITLQKSLSTREIIAFSVL